MKDAGVYLRGKSLLFCIPDLVRVCNKFIFLGRSLVQVWDKFGTGVWDFVQVCNSFEQVWNSLGQFGTIWYKFICIPYLITLHNKYIKVKSYIESFRG